MKIKNGLKLCFVISLSIISMSVLATPMPHTWHTVSSNNGAWKAQLRMINQDGSFVSRDGSSISEFNIDTKQSYDYGFVLDPANDFDVSYTLTLVQEPKNGTSNFSSKACVYVITAASPANPDIRASSFNDAVCQWNVVHGVGENFKVS